MTMDFASRALLNCSMDSWFYDGAVAKLVNKGTLAGTVQLGDGVTPATFPTQVFPHGMSFDGASDYLLTYTGTALNFPTPSPFSVELFMRRPNTAVGAGLSRTFAAMSSDGAGVIPWIFDEYESAGTNYLRFQSYDGGVTLRGAIINSLTTSQLPLSTIVHLVGVCDGTVWYIYRNAVQLIATAAAGCYASAASLSSYAYRQAVAGYESGELFNFAVYPFVLQPGEIAQLYRQRLGLLNRGA